MIKIKFNNETQLREIAFSRLSDNVVQLLGIEDENTSGFLTYRIDGITQLGDFSDYTTVYKTIEDGLQFSNDGSHYIPPTPPALEDVKYLKYKENDKKAETARESQSFTVTFGDTTLVFVTNRKTQGDLQNLEIAFLRNPSTTYDWTDEEGTQFTFTSIEQVDEIEGIFKEKVNVYDKWAYFKNLIDEATTVDEVRSIVIDYGINL